MSGPLKISKMKKGVTIHSDNLGGTKVAHPFAIYIVCPFGATYMDGMNCDPIFFIFLIFKGYQTLQAYPRFDKILTVWYFINRVLILALKFAHFLPL